MILYFSGTGNSKYVALTMGKKTNDLVFSIEDCLRVKNYDFTLEEGERLGIICPTYFFGIPSIVKDFLEKARFKKMGNNYIYVIVTCGGSSGKSLDYIEKLLKEEVSLKSDIIMVDTWTPLYDVSNLKENKIVEKKSLERLNDIIKKVLNKDCGDFQKFGCPMILSKLVYLSYEGSRRTKYFSVDDNCINCGMCAKKCPVKAISIKNGKPEWKEKKCTLCLRCLHQCPKQAISYKNKTKKHGQYTNPNVKI